MGICPHARSCEFTNRVYRWWLKVVNIHTLGKRQGYMESKLRPIAEQPYILLLCSYHTWSCCACRVDAKRLSWLWGLELGEAREH